MIVAYYPAWHGTPLWDDNYHLTPPGLASVDGLRRIWTEVGATLQYYPLLHSAFWVQHRLWGDAVLGYHLVNLGLHGLVSVGLMYGLRRLAVPGAAFAAAVFLLHPVHVESVAWITELKNTLSTVWYLGAALLFLRFEITRSWRFYGASLAVFALALLTKTVTGMLPFGLAIVIWWRRGRLRVRTDVLPLVPFAVLGIGMGLLTAWWEHEFHRSGSGGFALSVIERVLVGSRAILFQVASFAWPAHLSFSYRRWTVDSTVWWQYSFLAGVLLALLVAWSVRGRARGPLAALLFFIVSLAPTLGVFSIYTFRYSFVADHYQYVASFAGVAIIGCLWEFVRQSTLGRRSGIIRAAGGIALLAALAGLSWRQAHHYASADASYRAILAQDPDNWFAHANLGALLLETDVERATAHLEAALRLNPDIAEAHANLARVHVARRQFDLALRESQLALAMEPDLAGARAVAARALQELGRLQDSLREYDRAVRLRPGDSALFARRGDVLFALGRVDEALSSYGTAVAIDGEIAALHYNLGNMLQEIGRTDEAISEYQAALRIEESAEAHNNLGVALDRRGDLSKAEAEFRQALRVRPGYADAVFNLASLLTRTGHRPEAILLWQTLIATDPEALDARLELAEMLLQAGRTQEARGHLSYVLQQQPQHPVARAKLKRLGGGK